MGEERTLPGRSLSEGSQGKHHSLYSPSGVRQDCLEIRDLFHAVFQFTVLGGNHEVTGAYGGDTDLD